MLLLDSKAASALLRGRLCVCAQRSGKCREMVREITNARPECCGDGGLSFLRSTVSGRIMRTQGSRVHQLSSGTANARGTASQLGRDLPGELREPRLPGRGGD